ncbi:hypothetical protein JTE90_013098 [Oedothorax gibbosus]|uniref:Uncharacterized protein n=1 Tax=Oedothorax gibbosus TaxID=931172 RepID=A0AAV6UN79_9ARAC|nr:hypothetical protein JTE90_013098 [Oedothorax gibbosus]
MAYDSKVSIIVLGEMGVGKSSLLLRFAKNIFKEHLTSTIIIDCYHTVIYVKNKRVRLELWDTGGQERFKCVINSYFRKADGVLMVYDVTDVSSFQKLKSWFLKLKDENEAAISIIVGNKTDHPKGSSVEVSSVTTFAGEHNLVFYESSAKTGENVTKIFEELTERVLESRETNLTEKGLESKESNFTERMLDSKEINLTERLLESNETYLTERGLQSQETIPLIKPELPAIQQFSQVPIHLILESGKATTKNLETKNLISTSTTKQPPPKENVVLLHKAPPPPKKKKCRC